MLARKLTLFSTLFLFTLISCSDSDEKNETLTHDESHLSLNPDTLKLCTFNIQFLGHFKKRDNGALANILKDYDIITIQELVSPPYEGTFPDSTPYIPDPESKNFFEAMENHGFTYWLSEEDTGTNDEIHMNTSATEWWVTFYRENIVEPATDLPNGFLADDRSNHPDYERVPYAFAFRTKDNRMDFVLISVHLQPGGSAEETKRREHEISSIQFWIAGNNQIEQDFIILGDMNIEDSTELAAVLPEGYFSLNDECRQTNTLQGSGNAKPYDHIMFNINHTAGNIDKAFDCKVVNLIDVMKNYWTSEEQYPGDPYIHNTFKQYYSDHNPVEFRLVLGDSDRD